MILALSTWVACTAPHGRSPTDADSAPLDTAAAAPDDTASDPDAHAPRDPPSRAGHVIEPDEWSDVPIVIGAGPAGLAVALELGGALVLEAADQVGGRARYGSGSMFFVGTEEQAAAGLADTPALAEAEWEALTGAPATDATRAYLAATDGIRDRLVGLGLELRLFAPTPGFATRRSHAPPTGGPALVAALERALGPSVEVRLSTPVRGLVLVDGVAAGVRTDAGWIGADTVVIASGGFVDRADLVSLHSGWEAGTWRPGDDYGAAGAALDWAERSGLGTVGLDRIASYRDVLGLPGADGGAIRLSGDAGTPWVWVDAAGERFVDESATWSLILSGLADARPNVWAITTAGAIEDSLADADLPFLVEGAAWRCATDAASLAATLEIDPDGLAATADAVADVAARAATDPFGRPAETFPAGSGTPCGFRPGRIPAKNFGGLAVDADGRVLDRAGDVVPGLWAVGEAAGMGVPGMGGAWGFDGSLSAVLWSGFRAAEAIEADER